MNVEEFLNKLESSMEKSREKRMKRPDEKTFTFSAADGETRLTKDQWLIAGVGYAFGYADCLYKIRQALGISERTKKMPSA